MQASSDEGIDIREDRAHRVKHEVLPLSDLELHSMVAVKPAI